jgi:parallel beta-helix repeat protein
VKNWLRLLGIFITAAAVAWTHGTSGDVVQPVLDPVASYNAAGVIATTTGTISSGTNSLIVGSASGWKIGMGIAVANAGAGGNTELITSVTNIAGTTFTLAANATATATGQTVSHDDTAAILAAIGAVSSSLQVLHLRAGNYDVTSEMAITTPIIIECDGGVDNLTHGAPRQQTTGGTVIWNRGKTNNVFNISSGYVTIRNCAIIQDPNVTPTAGYAITIGSALHIRQPNIENNTILSTFGGIALTGGVGGGNIIGNIVVSLGGASNTACAVSVNNPTPNGGVGFVNNSFQVLNIGPVGCIHAADTNAWTANGFDNGDPDLLIDASAGTVNTQTFTGGTFESGGNTVNPLILVSGTTNSISSIGFVGGELGLDNGKGAIRLTGAQLTNVTITGMLLHNITNAQPFIIDATFGGGLKIMANVEDIGTTGRSTNILSGGGLVLGSTSGAFMTMASGELGFGKITASATAPGGGGGKIEFVCGTNAGTGKLIAFGGTSTTPTTVLDNIGSGVTGC